MRYETENGFVNTEKAICNWEETTHHNGNNHISNATGSQWEHETLYLSSKNNYYVVHTSQWQGKTDYARMLTDEEAATWLLKNGHPLPDAIAHYQAELEQ